jgi:polynucleotide 5'-hydroxyl-kinase GRC3/NOL9
LLTGISNPRSAVSAVAARRARQQQLQVASSHDNAPTDNKETEPPAKRPRPSPDRISKDSALSTLERANENRLAAPVKAVSADLAFELSNIDATEALKSETSKDGKLIMGDEIDEEEDTDVSKNAE